MYEYYIGSNGAIMFGSDSASTDATHFTKIIVALAAAMGVEVTPRSDSPVSNVAYNRNTHELTWLDNGQSQSVTIQHAKLTEFLDAAFAAATPTSVDTALGRIESLIQAEHELNLGAYNGVLDLKEIAYGHSTALGTIESKIDTEHGVNIDTYNGVLDLKEITYGNSTALHTIQTAQEALADTPSRLGVIQQIVTRIEAFVTWIAIPRLRLRDQVIGLRRFISAFVSDARRKPLDEDEIRVGDNVCKQVFTHPRNPKQIVFFYNSHTEPKESNESNN